MLGKGPTAELHPQPWRLTSKWKIVTDFMFFLFLMVMELMGH